MSNLSQLKLKKLQIFLAEKKYTDAVHELELMLANPKFPKTVQSRAAENIFTAYFASGQNPEFYNLIFSSPTFSHLTAPSINQSIYNYAQYGYNLYPGTIFGATIIYGKIENFDQNNPEQVTYLQTFVPEFLNNSDKEINILKQYQNQEIALINIFTERARVIHKTAKLIGETKASQKIEQNLYDALREAEIVQNPFYLFYTSYNYTDYAANGVIVARSEAEKFITSASIFAINNVPEGWYRSTIKGTLSWSEKRKEAVKKINPTLSDLIEYYK